MGEPRRYRFGDLQRPGLVFGLSARQAIPLLVGVAVLAVVWQTGLPPLVGVAGPVAGVIVAFGRWRGLPLAETLVPGAGLVGRRAVGRRCWVRPSLVGDNTDATLPTQLRGLRLHGVGDRGIGIVEDQTMGTLTAVLRVRGGGFALGGPEEQDALVAGWGAALSPFARERSPVRHVIWQEWAHPAGGETHDTFLGVLGVRGRAADPAVGDYLELVDHQAPAGIARDLTVTVTVDQPRRDGHAARFEEGVGVLLDEMAGFCARLEVAGLQVEGPLSAVEIAATSRVRSDPGRGLHVAGLGRSLAAAAGRGALEWGPMVTEPDWGHVRVDGAYHRSWRISDWPRLPVAADWLAGLLTDTGCVRTVTVVLEPVPMRRAARAADREVMAREADRDLKQQRGFRINAGERRRLDDAERREHELSEGHAEFAFVGIVTVTAPTLDQLHHDAATIERAAAACLLDVRPLDARHHHAWIAILPYGRALTPTRNP